MAGSVDGFADVANSGRDAGRCFVVHAADRFDFVVGIFAEPCGDFFRVNTVAPIAGNEFGIEADPCRQFVPERGELAGFKHQHFIARIKYVHHRGFPGAGAGCRKYDHRAFSFENALKLFQNPRAQSTKGRPPMIDDRHVHGPQNAVGHGARARDLQEVATATIAHDGSPDRGLRP